MREDSLLGMLSNHSHYNRHHSGKSTSVANSGMEEELEKTLNNPLSSYLYKMYLQCTSFSNQEGIPKVLSSQLICYCLLCCHLNLNPFIKQLFLNLGHIKPCGDLQTLWGTDVESPGSLRQESPSM